LPPVNGFVVAQWIRCKVCMATSITKKGEGGIQRTLLDTASKVNEKNLGKGRRILLLRNKKDVKKSVKITASLRRMG